MASSRSAKETSPVERRFTSSDRPKKSCSNSQLASSLSTWLVYGLGKSVVAVWSTSEPSSEPSEPW